MNNGQANCILQVCCRHADAVNSLADLMVEEMGCDRHEAMKYAEWTHKTFDLAPKGLLKPYSDRIAALARDGMIAG